MSLLKFSVASLVASVASTTVLAATVSVSPERQVELENLLLQDCGSCHGLTLAGGLGSPLTKEALAGKPEEYLFTTIREGIPGTPMPPWAPLLSDADVHWLVDRLMGGATLP